MIYINFVELLSVMLHAKFQNHGPSSSGKEDLLKVFAIYSYSSHLGHVTWTIYIKDGNEWQICYSNIRIHYSNVFKYSDRDSINVFIEISTRRYIRVSSLTQGVVSVVSIVFIIS